VVHRADKEIDGGVGSQGCDEGGVGRADPFRFKADEYVDLGGVFGAETEGFGDVGVVVGVGVVDCVAGCDLCGGLALFFGVNKHQIILELGFDVEIKGRMREKRGRRELLLRDTDLLPSCGACVPSEQRCASLSRWR